MRRLQRAGGIVVVSNRQVFAVTVESAFMRGLKAQMTPDLKSRLKTIGIDLDQRLKASYPLEIYEEALRTAARMAYPNLTLAAAYRTIGEQTARHYEHTMLGSLMIRTARLLGPHRLIAKAQTQFRTLGNYLDCSIEKTGPSSYRFWISDVGDRAPYFEGVVSTMLGFAGAKDVKMTIFKREPPSVTFDVEWKE